MKANSRMKQLYMTGAVALVLLAMFLVGIAAVRANAYGGDEYTVATNKGNNDVTLHTVSGSTFETLVGGNSVNDFPDLSITFDVDHTSIVQVSYGISMHCVEGNSSVDGSCHLVTRINVDGTPQATSQAIVGNTMYWRAQNTWLTTLAKGTHTIKVQYRTPAVGAFNNPASDAEARVLQVLVFKK